MIGNSLNINKFDKIIYNIYTFGALATMSKTPNFPVLCLYIILGGFLRFHNVGYTVPSMCHSCRSNSLY